MSRVCGVPRIQFGQVSSENMLLQEEAPLAAKEQTSIAIRVLGVCRRVDIEQRDPVDAGTMTEDMMG